jgi:hypothetical protein
MATEVSRVSPEQITNNDLGDITAIKIDINGEKLPAQLIWLELGMVFRKGERWMSD